jgi:hypothetical protein
VAGTGFEGRAAIIRKYCRDGVPVRLVREPNNPHDPKAVAVYLPVPRLFGLLGTSWRKIGYVKAGKNKGLSEKMDRGKAVGATVRSFYAPPRKEHPRVSILISIE